jgi:hypothetical protein
VLDREAVDYLRQVDKDPLDACRRVEHGSKKVSAAATNVCDCVEAAEVVGAENCGDVRASFGRHRLPEDFCLAGVILEVGPSPGRFNGFYSW